MKLPVQFGTFVKTCPTIMLEQTAVGYNLHTSGGLIFYEADIAGVISADCGQAIRQRRHAISDEDTIFGWPELSDAVFAWDPTQEIATLEKLLGKAGRGLDVGCGIGRLLLPMSVEGWRLDGVDNNLAAVTHLRSRCDEQILLFRANIADIVIPIGYEFAFAAMNTLRYLDSWHEFEAHLNCVSASLKVNGRYAFQITVLQALSQRIDAKWKFKFENQHFMASWETHSINLTNHTSVERVQIANLDKDQIVHEEYQHQLSFTESELNSRLIAAKSFQNLGYFDHQGRPLSREEARGNIWVLLEKSR